MSNEINTEVVTENNNEGVTMDTAEVTAPVETQTEAKTEETVEVETEAQESLEAREARLERQLKQTRKKLGKDELEKKSSKKSSELDYGEKAFLIANGVKGSEEMALAQDIAKRTGLELDELVTDDYFLGKLKSFRENKTAVDAIPKSTRRSSESPINSVDFHISRKTPLSEITDVNVRRQVLNKRIAQEKDNDKFSSSPVVNTLS